MPAVEATVLVRARCVIYIGWEGYRMPYRYDRLHTLCKHRRCLESCLDGWRLEGMGWCRLGRGSLMEVVQDRVLPVQDALAEGESENDHIRNWGDIDDNGNDNNYNKSIYYFHYPTHQRHLWVDDLHDDLCLQQGIGQLWIL